MKTLCPVYALVGPTAAGKSSLALQCARLLDAEIIGCDSVQVYRGFDVGSAKPDAAARAAVPHHLIDVASPDDPFDAMAYARAALGVVAQVQRRGKQALLCGGTGLYVRALSHGLIDVPRDAALRTELTHAYAAAPAAFYQRLQRLDPVTAAKLSPQNPAHVIRAVEVALLTGKAPSALRASHAAAAAQAKHLPRLHLLAVDGPSPWLRRRIVARAQQMVRDGLVAEVEALLRQGVAPDCGPMRAVGYKEARAVLRGELAPDALACAIATATWAYARRQRTWWRRTPPLATLVGGAAGEDMPALARLAATLWRAADAEAQAVGQGLGHKALP